MLFLDDLSSVDTVNSGVHVLVFRVVLEFGKAFGYHTITVAHHSLALIIGSCRHTDSVDTL